MEEVEELTTAIITVAWFNENEQAVTPDSATYRLDDVESDAAIKAETAISSPSTTNDIEVIPNENRIITAVNSFEKRRLTVKWVYDTDKEARKQYDYLVKNLAKVS